MLSLYEILKASKTGIASDLWTALAAKNCSGDSGAEVKELTGIPPLSIRSNGTMLLDYLISGNMVQTGTPTPQNPIQPQECGELETIGAKAGQYKIPISSANTTTNVYLGEVPTTRKIKRLVLTGEEGQIYANPAIRTSNAFYMTRANYLDGTLQGFCTHYPTTSQTSAVEGIYFGRNISIFAKLSDGLDTVAKLKAYFAAQYAAGTPVTVWYVLANPETAVVNEPLRKIGDYADTVSMEQAQVQIPTNRGLTTIDVATTLKPSEMYIKYRG